MNLRLQSPLRRFVLVLSLLPCLATSASAQTRLDPGEERDWRLLGSFAGSARSTLSQQVWNLLHEMENDGELYQDLGALSLGLGVDLGDDGKLDWDNYFTRRVYPMHENLAPGERLEEDDISRYMDLQTLVSRGRLRYAYVPDVVDNHGVELRLEGGVSLSLARARNPLLLGDRPLDEVLAERDDDDFQKLTENFGKESREDLLYLGARGVRGAIQWIANGFAERADTERSTLFWESYADPTTLGFELGVPADVDLFSSGDPRLHPGDRLRHITFLGISPLSFTVRELGFRAETRYFFRYLRETTIVEEENDHVLLTVRNVGSRGGELIPLKLRPELRILGIFKLGYTFFEERWERGRVVTSEIAYRIDLRHPRGRASLAALLEEGRQISFSPLNEAAREREGVEVLDWRSEGGHSRTGFRRAQVFSPFRYFNRRLTTQNRVEHENLAYNELRIARNIQLKKNWGRDRDWRRQFFLQSIVDPRLPGQNYETKESSSAAISLLTTVRDEHADPERLRRARAGLELVAGPHDSLEELDGTLSTEEQKAFFNVEITLAAQHLELLATVSKDEVWSELAAIFLGEGHRGEWASAQGRQQWRKRDVRAAFASRHRSELDARVAPIPGVDDIHDRFRMAQKIVKRFRQVQRLVADGDCIQCGHDAFRKWKEVILLQVLLSRLAQQAPGEPPGYHYEIFSDAMLRPVTVSNQIRHDFDTAEEAEAGRKISITQELTAEDYQQEVRQQKGDWFGRKNFLDPSSDRLRGGLLYKRITPDPKGESYCLMLRLFTDYLVAPGLSARIDLREDQSLGSDVTLRSSRFPIGEPTEILQTPFQTSRYHYDIPIPFLTDLEPDQAHSLLMRLLNAEGYPVTEEQQIRFHTPKMSQAALPEGCRPGTEHEIVLEGEGDS